MDKLNIEEVTSFFKNDEDIKKMLFNTVPSESDFYDEDSRIKYQDKLFKLLKDMKIAFKEMSNIYKSKELDEKIEEKFINLENQLAECGSDTSKLTEFYRKKITDMDWKLSKKLDEECYGYSAIPNDPRNFLEDKHSLNDLLHILHTCAVNDNEFYSRIPLIVERNDENSKKNHIRMYGEEFELSKELFEKFPDLINNEYYSIDILSLKDQKQIYIMIRDLGHALTININGIDEEKILVQYFIPKICNADKVNKLEGVTKVSVQAPPNDYTIGDYQTGKEEFFDHFFDFLSKVPTDEDIDIDKVLANAKVIDREDESDKEKQEENKEIENENKIENEEQNENSTNLPMVTKNTFPQKIKNKLKSVFHYIRSLRKKENKNDIEDTTKIQNSAQIAHNRLIADLAKSARRNPEINEDQIEKNKNVEKNEEKKTKEDDRER